MKKPHLTVGNRIAIAREKYGMSQGQVGLGLGLTRAAISQYEKNMIQPRRVIIAKLAALFNADPEWFEHGRGKAPDVLDAPVVVPEINVTLLPKVVDPYHLAIGREWRLPVAAFPETKVHKDMVVIEAPNAAGPIQTGDRVLIDTDRHDGNASDVFLICDTTGAELRQLGAGFAEGTRIVGRAAVYLRAL